MQEAPPISPAITVDARLPKTSDPSSPRDKLMLLSKENLADMVLQLQAEVAKLKTSNSGGAVAASSTLCTDHPGSELVVNDPPREVHGNVRKTR